MMNAPFAPSRRDLLKGTGALMVAFSIHGLPALAQNMPAPKIVAPDQVDGFLAIDEKGMVTVYAGKVDLGTGVRTAFTQIVAEELDVPMRLVNVIQGDTALTPDQGPTYGSQSVQTGGAQIRQAAATARNALLEAASARLGVAKDDLVVTDGVVSAKSGDSSISFAGLIGGKNFSLKLDPAAPLKNPADYKIVGKSVARLDIPGKVTGQFTYMQDFQVPGMLHGRVVRPPALGATLENVDKSSITDIPGIVKIVRQGNFLGIVAKSEWSAVRAARDIKATWSKSETSARADKTLGACPKHQDP